MKRVTLWVSVLLAASIFLSACAGQSAAQPPAGDPTGVPAAEETEPTPTVSEEPVIPAAEPPAPTEPVPAGEPVEVQVTLGDNWIQSSQTAFKVGVTYRFVITNTGRRNHMFDISKPAEKTTSAIREAMQNAILSVSDDQLPPGAQVTVDFTFTAPAAPGELEFACLIERHYKDGQYLGIVVEP